MKRALSAIAVLVVAAALVWWSTRGAGDDASANRPGEAGRAVAQRTGAPALPAGAGAGAGSAAAPPVALGAGAGQYPVNLDELRAKLPHNLYWELGAPTSDPAVAKARAERAKRDNELFGRTQTGEATKAEIRAYYAGQRKLSEDYLELSLTVLAEKGDQLPERDRGMFELSVQLHRAKLKQIERDLTDALERRGDLP